MTPVILSVFLLLSPEAPFIPPYTVPSLASDAFENRDPQYLECIQMVKDDPEIGRYGAEQWSSEGGGAPAQHCLAIAELANGLPRLAAVRLFKLAQRTGAGDERTRAIVFAEAALAFIDAQQFDLAVEAAQSALALGAQLDATPAELHFVAAKAFSQDSQWQKAIAAITEFEKQHAMTAEAHVIRARGKRALLKDDEAALDVVAALRLEPTNIDALTLRGDLAQVGVNINVRLRQSTN